MAAVGAVTLTVGLLNHSFSSFPEGYDAYGHMSKVRFLVDYFPNGDWNSEWYSGEYFAEGSFPPLFHYLGAILAGWFGLSLGDSLLLIAAASFVAITCGLYGFVRVATGKRIAALIAALLLLSANAFWSYVLLGGLYPRILGMAFLSLFAFFAAVYFRTRSSWARVAMVLTLAGALSSHLLLGAIGVALAVLVVAVMPRTVSQRVSDAAKLLLHTALLVAYFYLPYLASLSRPSPVPIFTRQYTPLSIAALLAKAPSPIESLPILITGLAAVVPAFVYFNRRFVLDGLARRFMPVLAIGGAGAVLYAVTGLPGPHVFIYNFQPGQALFFAAWFLAGLIGIAVSAYSGPRLPRWVLPGLALALLGFVAVTPTRLDHGVINADNPDKQQIISALHIDPADRQHRVGAGWDAGSDWINSRYDVPQTRGYQQQGVVDADWQYWLESRVWSAEGNFEEKNFLLDWYAVRSFYGFPVPDSFASRPDLYAPQDGSGQAFDFLKAAPILSARATRTALVIGGDARYRYLFRALAASDFDSQSVIPLRGGEYADDHTLAELRQFDLVVLYGFRAHDLAASLRLLGSYVVGGGNLLVEANGSPLNAAASVAAPIPGSSIATAQVGPDWKLSAGQSPITAGVQLADFDPAVYDGAPWGISYIPQTAIAPWAAPVLLSDGRPVVVAGTLGAGHVVWSGMNLPYHAATTRNAAESRLLAGEITWTAPKHAAAPSYQAEFVNPQLRRVSVSSETDGVLFKENFVANWSATIDGKPATIYRAGPDFMYVPLGPNARYPATVEFVFARTALEWAGDGISLVSLVGLLAWLFLGAARRRGRTAS